MRLLAVLDRADTAVFTLEALAGLLNRLGPADSTILHVEPVRDPDYLSPDEGMPGKTEHERFVHTVSARADTLRQIAQEWTRAVTPPRDTAWTERVGDVRTLVGREAAGVDITVLSRPLPHDDSAVAEAFAGALYDAQAAVLIAPLEHCATFGQHPVVAWRPSYSLDLAVQAALPLLERASRVTFIIGENTPMEVPAPPLGAVLAQMGVSVQVDRFLLGAGDTGEQVRQRALAVGGDLLVMGAYTRPHFIEWLFGGPTQDILAHGTLPILTRHAPLVGLQS
jgi:nucleotide-binding universal stress UspA family protein